jgi:hypothetical protein
MEDSPKQHSQELVVHEESPAPQTKAAISIVSTGVDRQLRRPKMKVTPG